MRYQSVSEVFAGQRKRALEGTGTRHCVSGSLRRLYGWAGIDVEEELLLGLGEGVGFIYWHSKGSVPMLGGRAQPKGGMECIAAQRTGVDLATGVTASEARARAGLVDMLEKGKAVMLQVDMGFLPYFDFSGGGYHFGGHVVLACGYDRSRDVVLVADREQVLYEVPMAAISKARGSKFKPFPPANRWWSGNFDRFHLPEPKDMALALEHQAQGMLNPPIANLGCRGIATASGRVTAWPGSMAPQQVKDALLNLWIFASPVGGSGGGNFRHMLTRYASLCATACRSDRYAEAAAGFGTSALLWDQAAQVAKDAVDACGGGYATGHTDPEVLGKACRDIGGILEKIGGVEAAAWALCDSGR